ncbi:hypothetical protein [Streptomyces sp900129855]|uniref:DUF397 domain-containing protein n=1 Tax=Streptomyces sp. 900129855 TaxID=3155129 RepID=A0ABV2ZJM5_9ACTN
MTHTAQEQHPSTSTTHSSSTPVACAQLISPHARAYASRHGDPLKWSAEKWRTYLELGGGS